MCVFVCVYMFNMTNLLSSKVHMFDLITFSYLYTYSWSGKSVGVAPRTKTNNTCVFEEIGLHAQNMITKVKGGEGRRGERALI